MALLTTPIEWHDLRIDPDDLPGAEEPILVTIEDVIKEDRYVWLDVYLKETEDDTVIFCTKAVNEYGQIEETMVWNKVVAWAYPPPPYNYF